MIDILIKNKEFFGIVATLLGVIIPLATFLITKNREQKQANFKKFHQDLVKNFANIDKKIGIAQQVAIIYEFINYPEYFPVIKRILSSELERWKKISGQPGVDQLIEEAEKTINFISQNLFYRLYFRIKNKIKIN
jgi:hypothetical protein